MRVLISGATGCVGSHLARRLSELGCEIRVLLRQNSDPSALEGLELERFEGDIRDRERVREAVRGCEQVFHVAATLSGWERKRDEIWEVNVRGTQHMIEACMRAGVSRFIFTSSAAAVGYSRDPKLVLDEDAPWPDGGLGLTYPDSKRAAEEKVLAAVKEGLPAVVCNPSLVFGAWDRMLHSAGLLKMARRGGLLFYPTGGVGTVWAGDVAEGHILAAERGQIGRRYILNGENLSYQTLFMRIHDVVGGFKPTIPLSETILKAGSRFTERAARWRDIEPTLTRHRAIGISSFQYVSDARARAELGYRPHPISVGIQETAQWLSERNNGCGIVA